MPFHLSLLPSTFAICLLDADASVPDWAQHSSADFFSLTRTADELSIVCRDDAVPNSVQSDRDWRCLKVAGPLDLAATGILSSLTRGLPEAEIPVFGISTFATDYLLVKSQHLDLATAALRLNGHTIVN